MREKNDKFQQRRLDSFFKASVQEGEDAGAIEEEAEEQPVPLEVMAMEVEMEVCFEACCAAMSLQLQQWVHFAVLSFSLFCTGES